MPIADIHSAHMLTSGRFVKYQCICCPGAVPKTSCTIHTHHSLVLFVFYRFYLFVCCKSFSNPKKFFPIHDFVLIATENLQSAFLQREVLEALGFSMVQNGMLWLEHTPTTLLWDSSTKRLVGRWCFFLLFFSTFKNLLKKNNNNGVAWLVLAPALDVPLHVKSQMVRPGETSGDSGERGNQ